MSRSNEVQRRLDRWLGSAILRVLAAMRGRRERPTHPRRIGFLEPTAIGDLILDTDLFVKAHAAFPGAELHLFHGPTNAGLLPLLPVKLIAHSCDFSRPIAALAEIRSIQPDLLVDCTNWPRLTAALSALSGAYTIGFETPGQQRHFAYDKTVPHSLGRHERDNRAALAAALTGSAEAYEPALSVPAASLPDLPYDRLILCHISPGGSRAREKSWPQAQWVELTRRLAADGFVMGFTGAPQDREAIEAVLVRTGLPPAQAVLLSGRLNLVQTARLMTMSRLLITVDTATVHLGSSLGIPMIALHGPSASRRWGATSAKAANIDAPHPEAGFIHFGYEQSAEALAIMPTITVDAVYNQATRKLKGQA
jgi:ADP-heptose:LPS heptosyltransferase